MKPEDLHIENAPDSIAQVSVPEGHEVYLTDHGYGFREVAPSRRFLTADEAAKILGTYSEQSIENWLKGGHFPGSVQVEDEWFFDENSVYSKEEKIQALIALNESRNLTVPDSE